MGCCHTEIDECRQDINQLQTTRGKFPAITDLNADIKETLGTIASLCEETFAASAMEDIKTALKSLTAPFQSRILTERADLDESMRRVRQAKAAYTTEDRDYHEQEH